MLVDIYKHSYFKNTLVEFQRSLLCLSLKHYKEAKKSFLHSYPFACKHWPINCGHFKNFKHLVFVIDLKTKICVK